MNREDRRRQERFLKKKKHTSKSEHSTKPVAETREKLKEFLKTYEFKGSLFEEGYQNELALRKLKSMCGEGSVSIRLIDDCSEEIMTLAKDHPVVREANKEVIKTDIFLVRESDGWYIKYDKLPFYQNLLVFISELDFAHIFDQELNVGAKIYGYQIPMANHLVRQAIDRLSLRYESEWVNL